MTALRVYHVSPVRVALATGFFVAIGCGLLYLALAVPDEPESRNAFLLTAMFIFACACVMYVTVRYPRLELSAHGVRLRQIGYALETTWDNVESLYDVAGAQGIVLRRPMSSGSAGLLRAFRYTGTGAGVRFYNPEQIQLLAEQRFIPIDAFAFWLERGLRAEIETRTGSRPLPG